MNLPTFTMRELLEAGVHFGHVTRRWNPEMESYLFGVRQGIHIIDLQQTVPLLYQAMKVVNDVVAAGGRVLFVGTKRQASKPIEESAKSCGQYYVNHRWLGGMMTNWKTISNSINKLEELEVILGESNANNNLSKKELLQLSREKDKLISNIGGIRNLGGKPDILLVFDVVKDKLAVLEANKLGIPVIAIVDTNSNPDLVEFPIPGNDDAIRSIRLITKVISDACARGIESAQGFVPKSDSPVIKKVKKEEAQESDTIKESSIDEAAENSTTEDNKEEK